jgi:hypothetical protein
VQRTGCVVVTRSNNDSRKLSRSGGLKSDVNETRSGHVSAGDTVDLRQLLGNGNSQITWIKARRFRHLEGHARGPVTVVTILRALNDNVGGHE